MRVAERRETRSTSLSGGTRSIERVMFRWAKIQPQIRVPDFLHESCSCSESTTLQFECHFRACHIVRHEFLHHTPMYDSETESEPECDLKKWDATEFASQLPRAISENSDRDLAERVTDAIATLKSIPVEEVLMVGYHDFAPIVGSDWISGCRMEGFIGRLKVQPTRSSCF